MYEGSVVAYQASISREDGPGYVQFKWYQPLSTPNVPPNLEILRPQVFEKMYDGALKCFKKEYVGVTLGQYFTGIVTNLFFPDYKPVGEGNLSIREEDSICFGEFETCFYKPTGRDSSESEHSLSNSGSNTSFNDSQNEWFIFVYYDQNQKVLASCLVERDGNEYEIHEVCALICGRGIGSRLVGQVVETLRKRSNNIIKIFCYNDNRAALGCYRKAFAGAKDFIGDKDGRSITLFVQNDTAKQDYIPKDNRFNNLRPAIHPQIQPSAKKQN